MSDEKVLTAQEKQDRKDANKFKFFYPFSELCASWQKSFFGTYLTFMYTNVYMFSVNYTAIMSVCSNLVGWVVTPLFAAFVDKTKFKKSKFWPWIAVGAVISLGIQFLITGLPYITGKTTELAPFIFALVLLMTVCGPMLTGPINGAFPRMGSRSASDRQFLAMGQKIGRDGGKTIFASAVTALLVYFSGSDTFNMRGYALTGLVAAAITLLGYELLAFCGLRGSFVEREALADTEKAKAEKVPFSQQIKALINNRPLLGIFLWMLLHKSYYFIYTSYAAYVFTYVFGNAAKMGIFFTVFNLTAIIGVMFGKVLVAIFKDSKKSHVACYVIHMIFLAAIAVLFKKVSADVFIVLFGCSSFFMGMLENWVLPGFAAAAEYGAWISGNRMDSFLMSLYSLSVSGSLLVTTLVGTAFLNACNYTEFVASGATTATAEVYASLSNLYSIAPLVISCVALVCLLFVYNLNDKRTAAIQKDLAEGKTKATSTIDWASLK